MARGTFIVIEGTDGSGKTAQFERLILALPERIKIGTLDFPRYQEASSYFVQKYLSGRYGANVSPEAASLFYAVDRFDAKLKLLQWLEEEGRLIVANRYVASNMAYQGAKIADEKERRKFYEWLHHLEYDILGLPKPDLNIMLHVPAEVAHALIEKRGEKRDIHEMSFELQKRAEHAYVEIAELFPDEYKVIECVENNTLLSMEEIHEKVWAAARKVIGL